MAEATLEAELQREWRANTSHQIGALETKVDVIGASMITRQDVSSLLNERVDKDAYQVAHQAIVERLVRIEGGAGRLVPWIGVGISGCALLLTLLSMASGVVLFLVLHH